MANSAYKFRIELREIEPLIWRRIVVPATYSFWDLHVAIQDAMGWLDCHLHAFQLLSIGRGQTQEIGIPDERSERDCVASWDAMMSDYFVKSGGRALYEYDFGDGWTHQLILEAIIEEDNELPKCIAGERACPPEDCG